MSYIPTRFSKVNNLRNLLLKAMVDDDVRDNCWGNEVLEENNLPIKKFPLVPALVMSVVTVS